MWPLCRNVTRPWRLMALLGLVSWGGAQSSEVPSEGDSQQAQLMKGAYLAAEADGALRRLSGDQGKHVKDRILLVA